MRLTKRRSALTADRPPNTTSTAATIPYSASASFSTPSLHSPTLRPKANPGGGPPSPGLPSTLSRSHSAESRSHIAPPATAPAFGRRDRDGKLENRKRDTSGDNRYPPNSFVLGYGWGFGRMRKARKEKERKAVEEDQQGLEPELVSEESR